MSNKSLFLFLGILLLTVGIIFAYNSAVSRTSDGQLYTGSVIVAGASLDLVATNTYTAKLYNGTSTSGTLFAVMDQYHPQIMFPDGYNADGGVYADCSWSGTGTGNPSVILYIK